MNGQTEKQIHSVSVNMRKDVSISGVRSVESFDENEVLLQTVKGDMTVEGSGLRIGVLDTDRGVVTISGKIDAILYSDEQGDEKRGFFGRLFR